MAEEGGEASAGGAIMYELVKRWGVAAGRGVRLPGALVGTGGRVAGDFSTVRGLGREGVSVGSGATDGVDGSMVGGNVMAMPGG